MYQLYAVKDSVLTWGGLVGTSPDGDKAHREVRVSSEESAETVVPTKNACG